jgi:hypothetical protein
MAADKTEHEFTVSGIRLRPNRIVERNIGGAALIGVGPAVPMPCVGTGPLDRCLRDVLIMAQHVVGTLRPYEMAGRLLLGMQPRSGGYSNRLTARQLPPSRSVGSRGGPRPCPTCPS